MDRTAWIVIGVCAALLGLNIYMGNNKKEEPVPAAPAPVQQTAAALEASALQRRALLLQVVFFHPQLLAVVASKGDLQRFCCVLTLHATRRLSA